MQSSTLIKGKHYKQVIIDYYDDLIAQVDIYAEIILEKVSNSEIFKDYDEKSKIEEDEKINDLNSESNLYFQSIESKFKDPYTSTYTFQPETIEFNETFLVNDFVHSERIKSIEVLKHLQKTRLDELKSAPIKPNSTETALFGNKFGFLVNLNSENSKKVKMKFRLLTLVIDFYLEENDIKFIGYY